jgi:Bacterial Ig domain
VNISGGTPPYTVTLDNGGGTQTNSSPLTFAVNPATTTTYSIASAIDANGCIVTPAGSAIVTVNRIPTAGLDQLQTQINAPLAVPAASLLTNDFDPDADSLSVSSVTPASTRGGTVGLTAGTVTYTPPTNFFGTDSFQYTLADSRGCHSSGTVEMTVVNPLGYQLTITSLSNAYQLEFIGVPGQSYFFQSATSVVGPWSNLYNSITAGPSGLIVTNDTNTPFPGTKYYQVAQ